MAVDLGLDSRLSDLENVGASAVGYATNNKAVLRAGFGSAVNPFGSAALLNTGSAPGNLVALDDDGLLPSAVVPAPTIDPAALFPSALAVAALAAEARATFDSVDADSTFYDVAGGDIRLKTAGLYLASAALNSAPANTAVFNEMQLLVGPPGAQSVIAEYDPSTSGGAAGGFSRATITAMFTADANDRVGASVTGVTSGEQATFTLGLARFR